MHTGALGSLQSDGYLKLTGRIKELIIRGEVYAVISKFDIVNNVKVIGLPNDFVLRRVRACIKLKTGKICAEEKFRAELSADLARYKIPFKFVIVDEFPMLGTGKIVTPTQNHFYFDSIPINFCRTYPKTAVTVNTSVPFKIM